MKVKVLLILISTMLLLMAPAVRAPNGIPGDINEDGKVDISDVVLAASQYGLKPGDAGYNSTIVEKADLAPPFNGVINMLDMVTITYHYTG